jgi:hypothetical protein
MTVCSVCGVELSAKSKTDRCPKHHRGPDPQRNPNLHHRTPRTPDVSRTDAAKRYMPEGEKP